MANLIESSSELPLDHSSHVPSGKLPRGHRANPNQSHQQVTVRPTDVCALLSLQKWDLVRLARGDDPKPHAIVRHAPCEPQFGKPWDQNAPNAQRFVPVKARYLLPSAHRWCVSTFPSYQLDPSMPIFLYLRFGISRLGLIIHFCLTFRVRYRRDLFVR